MKALVGIYRACDGSPGIAGLRELSAVAIQGFAIIDDALGHRHREEAEELEKKAKQPAPRSKPRR